MDNSPSKLDQTLLSDLFAVVTAQISQIDAMLTTWLQDALRERFGATVDESRIKAVLLDYVEKECEIYQKADLDFIDQWADADGDVNEDGQVPHLPPDDRLSSAALVVAMIGNRGLGQLAFSVCQLQHKLKAAHESRELAEELARKWKSSYEEAMRLVEMHEQGGTNVLNRHN